MRAVIFNNDLGFCREKLFWLREEYSNPKPPAEKLVGF